jgi:hypothetical protein
MIKSNRPILNDDKQNIETGIEIRMQIVRKKRSGTSESKWKYQMHVGLMNSEVILGHDHGDVQEYDVLRLRFILLCLLRKSFSGVIWHCNGLCERQRAVCEHLLNDKEIKLHSILLLIKLKYVNTFTMGFVTNSFEECEYYSR